MDGSIFILRQTRPQLAAAVVAAASALASASTSVYVGNLSAQRQRSIKHYFWDCGRRAR